METATEVIEVIDVETTADQVIIIDAVRSGELVDRESIGGNENEGDEEAVGGNENEGDEEAVGGNNAENDG
ncbi:MAG: hypothetical protein ACRDVC_03525 [Acidimicrobiales bacterium]